VGSNWHWFHTIGERKDMATVIVRERDDVHKAIKKFKRKVEAEGIMRELKKRRYYMKPSVKKKEKRKLAEKKRRKMMKKRRNY